MAVAVVDELEVVEVDQQARQRPAGPRGAADLLVQAPAHRAMVHAAGHRVGPRLGARSRERQRGRALLDERGGELDCGRSRRRVSARRTSSTTASTSPRSASGKQQRAARPRPVAARRGTLAGELCGSAARKLLAGLATQSTPAGARPAAADSSAAPCHRTCRQRRDPPRRRLGDEMVDVDLVGARRRQQLTGERPEDRVGVPAPSASASAGGCRRAGDRCPRRTSRYPYP